MPYDWPRFEISEGNCRHSGLAGLSLQDDPRHRVEHLNKARPKLHCGRQCSHGREIGLDGLHKENPEP